MTHRIGSKGQVVIPKELRRRHGLAAGVSVTFEEREGAVVVKAARVDRPLKGRYAQSGMAARLSADRAEEPR